MTATRTCPHPGRRRASPPRPRPRRRAPRTSKRCAPTSSGFGPAGRAALDANAAILQRHPDVRVEVQGHADARGTVDYNLALGFRRSAAVVDHLRARGVSAQQLAAVSYGEEIPLARGDGEPVWAQNRRAEFRVIAGPQTVEGTVASR